MQGEGGGAKLALSSETELSWEPLVKERVSFDLLQAFFLLPEARLHCQPGKVQTEGVGLWDKLSKCVHHVQGAPQPPVRHSHFLGYCQEPVTGIHS